MARPATFLSSCRWRGAGRASPPAGGRSRRPVTAREQGPLDSLAVTRGPASEGVTVPSKPSPKGCLSRAEMITRRPGERGGSASSSLHAFQGREKLCKGKDFSFPGSSSFFSRETPETACQHRSLLLKLPSLESAGSQGVLGAEEGERPGRVSSPQQSGDRWKAGRS